ncbi:MAG: hypothetical protein R6X19_00105 [Kiritimatiellia bacterium]
MFELSDIQKDAVKKWLADGAGISDVQNRLIKEFDLRPTYMDVRMLILELGATVQEKKPAITDLNKKPAAIPGPAGEAAEEDDGGAPPLPGEAPAGLGAVTVEVDRIMKPGALVSGTVTFSDGIKAQWSLDQTGRLGLAGVKPGYRPSQTDVQEFQLALQKELAKQGF